MASPRIPPTAAQGFALFALGFRPLYLLAALFAVLSIAIWAARFAGHAGDWVYGSDPLWHAHEMIFGYAFAVIVGFLFTAVRNWTARPTPRGAALAAIAALWAAARILVLTPWIALAAAADVLFALAAAAGIAVPLVASGNRRNYFFIALILALGAANLAFYLGKEEIIALPPDVLVEVALDLILFVIAVIGGRVIPMFTANAVPTSRPRRYAWLERLALGVVLLLAIADAAELPERILGTIAGVAAAAHLLRLLLWQPQRSFGRPILWILHVSYAWVVVHLALRSLAAADLVAGNLATHALTVGAIGGMTLGMMTRTARGHTGRPLEAGAIEVAAYLLVQLAAIARVFVPIAAPARFAEAVTVSGILWALAFALFVVRYLPILVRPRADGQPG